MNLIDLISILPFFLGPLLDQSASLTVIRILRLCRLFRLFKLKKYSAGFEVFLHTLVSSMEAITVMLFILALLLVFLGSLVYLAEGGSWYQPDYICKTEEFPQGVTCAEAGYPEGAYLRKTNDQKGNDVLVTTPFTSVFESCWFIMATITTVGYGDMVSARRTTRLLAGSLIFVSFIANHHHSTPQQTRAKPSP